MDFEKVNDILEKLQRELAIGAESTVSRKRIYSTAVETLENILRHTNIEDNPNFPPHFLITKATNNYLVESCNLVTAKQKQELTEKIDYINANDKILNKIFAEKLKTTKISNEGGAGLGVYIIGKNASKKICYTFKDINEKQSYFCLKIKI